MTKIVKFGLLFTVLATAQTSHLVAMAQKKIVAQQEKMVEEYLQSKRQHRRLYNVKSNNYILRKIINTPYISEDKKIRDLKTVLRALITNINAADGVKQTAVNYAVIHRNPKVLELLIMAGANIKIIDPETKKTILHDVAAFTDPLKLQMLNILIKYGADIDQKNCNGQTALHIATIFGNLNGIKLLVENGNAKLDEKDDWEWTALDIAKNRGYSQIVSYLSTITDKKKIITQTTSNSISLNSGTTNTNLMGNLSLNQK